MPRLCHAHHALTDSSDTEIMRAQSCYLRFLPWSHCSLNQIQITSTSLSRCIIPIYRRLLQVVMSVQWSALQFQAYQQTQNGSYHRSGASTSLSSPINTSLQQQFGCIWSFHCVRVSMITLHNSVGYSPVAVSFGHTRLYGLCIVIQDHVQLDLLSVQPAKMSLDLLVSAGYPHLHHRDIRWLHIWSVYS